MTDLEKAIWRTVCWFAIFEYPLTAFEFWKWLWSPGHQYSLAEVFDALAESPWLHDRLQVKQGFYARRPGRPMAELVAERQQNFLDSVRKYKKLRSVIDWLSLAPGVRGIAAVNTMSWWQTNGQSDIDLFIIVQPGSIWLSRLLLVTPFALLKKRPGAADRLDPFCFTFFVSQSAIDLKPLAVLGADPYLAYWTMGVVPVFGRAGQWREFQAENQWAKEYLPNAFMRPMHRELAAAGWRPWPGSWKFLDQGARRIQERRFPEKIQLMKNRDSRVVVNNEVLKFHVDDPRQEFKRRWQELINYEA
ncbi:hypothetical protein KJ611_03655 [Patescibacteria group bacterium]|nr:hypothetical protein [Patescibacteria group bacterium]MBU1705256.1 hypothetical protein [Patescibacteria group bacterium]